MTKFEKDCAGYSIEDLELIVETQQDLYSDEEMDCLIKTLEKKKQAAEIERIKNLPKEIKCPKCDVILPIETVKCPYCEFEFIGDKYQYAENDEKSSEFENTMEINESNNNTIAYILSFIIPLVGFVLGANLMSKDDENDKSQGITCIIIGIISVVVSSIVLYLVLCKL